MGSVTAPCLALLSLLPAASAATLPAMVIHRFYHHQLPFAGASGCAGYQPRFLLAGGELPEGVRLTLDGRVTGEAVRIASGTAAVRVETPCSCGEREWSWTVRGAPVLDIAPPEIVLDRGRREATALVSSSWRDLAYTVSNAAGGPLPAWLKVRPRRGRTPAEGSALTGDRLLLVAVPELAPPGARAELLVHSWQASEPVPLSVRFGPEPETGP